MKTIVRQALDNWLVDTYLDWVNNYLTLDKMASDYELSYHAMNAVIEEGRALFEEGRALFDSKNRDTI